MLMHDGYFKLPVVTFSRTDLTEAHSPELFTEMVSVFDLRPHNMDMLSLHLNWELGNFRDLGAYEYNVDHSLQVTTVKTPLKTPQKDVYSMVHTIIS